MNSYLSYLKKRKDISYYTYPFPTGRLYIFADRDSIKLVQFGSCIDHKMDIQKKFKAVTTEEIEKAIEFLDHYLMAERGVLPRLDLGCFSEKVKRVYDELVNIQFGSTISYKELSERAGIKNGARFVGNTMARNHFPIFIPCHRVINSNGIIGNFQAGKSVKKFLLEHEKVMLK